MLHACNFSSCNITVTLNLFYAFLAEFIDFLHIIVMSNPYRGDEIVADNISSQNVEKLKSRFEEELRPQLAFLTLVDRIGGDELVERVFGKIEPRKPGERSVLDCSITSELCKACRSIFTTETEKISSWYPGLTDQTQHHSNAEDLQTAARNGCHMCLVLWNRITGGLPFDDTNKSTSGCPLTDLVDYITYSVGGPSTDSEDDVYTLHFVYKGHGTPYITTKCRRLRLCMIPKTG